MGKLGVETIAGSVLVLPLCPSWGDSVGFEEEGIGGAAAGDPAGTVVVAIPGASGGTGGEGVLEHLLGGERVGFLVGVPLVSDGVQLSVEGTWAMLSCGWLASTHTKFMSGREVCSS